MLKLGRTFDILSIRERQIATLLLDGITTTDIAKKLEIKSNTVSTMKKRIYIKLGVVSAVGLYKLFTE